MRYLIVNKNGITDEFSNSVLPRAELSRLVGNPRKKTHGLKNIAGCKQFKK